MKTLLAGVAIALLLLAPGCSRHRLHQLTHSADMPDELPVPGQVQALEAHLRNGQLVVFDHWRVSANQDEIAGQGRRLDVNRFELEAGEIAVPVDSVVVFESKWIESLGPHPALVGMTVISGVITVACLANPKACFGSCPTFYVEHPSGSGDWHLVAEGFSSSIARPLEATDHDALWHARDAVVDGQLTMRVTNEAYETHVIRHADLLVASLPDDGSRAAVDAEGGAHRLRRIVPASAAVASTGDDPLPALLEAEGFERVSLADDHDLGAKETLELAFDLESAEEIGLVLHLRQSLMSTWLFYQALSYLGDTTAHWLAELERGNGEAMEHTFALGRALGGIEVQVPDAASEDGWRTVAIVHETGPLARDTDLVPLGRHEAGRTRVRLRMTQGLWRLDQVALGVVAGPVELVRCRPKEVRRDGRPDPDALAALLDPERTLVTLPGDELTLRYELPEESGPRYEILLESRGWYLEWMREEWLEEQNPWAAAAMFLDPASALRRLAPRYKQVESEMEDLFWGSRYAKP